MKTYAAQILTAAIRLPEDIYLAASEEPEELHEAIRQIKYRAENGEDFDDSLEISLALIAIALAASCKIEELKLGA